jgi:hypothetical protein
MIQFLIIGIPGRYVLYLLVALGYLSLILTVASMLLFQSFSSEKATKGGSFVLLLESSERRSRFLWRHKKRPHKRGSLHELFERETIFDNISKGVGQNLMLTEK